MKKHRIQRMLLTAFLLGMLGGCGGEVPADAVTEAAAEQTEETLPAEEKPEKETMPATEEETEEPEAEEEPEEAPFAEKRILFATDMHYLAEEYSAGRGSSFRKKAAEGDGQVLEYSWEILDAFLDDVTEERPDVLVLGGDLTMDGEKKSHEELAEKLCRVTDAGIEVAVIPGNHDINNRNAKRFTPDGTEAVPSVSAEEFRQIYNDFGYMAADSRDPASLSYLYKLGEKYWLLLLDSCQYEPQAQVGGMIRRETYEWMEPILEEAAEQGAQVISVTHHNLLTQSGVSREYYDDCTIEHGEVLAERLSEAGVRFHLSGHLHMQHYKTDEETGISEAVTGALTMTPCGYGRIELWSDGTVKYDLVPVDVEGWAQRKGYENSDLQNFAAFSRNYLGRITYAEATADLRRHTLDREIFFSDEQLEEMAQFYAEVCVHYISGRMFELGDAVFEEPACEWWDGIGYASDLTDFLRNILEDEPHDFAHLVLEP